MSSYDLQILPFPRRAIGACNHLAVRLNDNLPEANLTVQRNERLPIVGAEAKLLAGKGSGRGDFGGDSGDNADPAGRNTRRISRRARTGSGQK